MASERSGSRIGRFSVAERALHWLLAGTFLVMLASGLALYVPRLSTIVDRPTAKEWHIDAALALAAGLLGLLVVRWRRMRAMLRELDRFDEDDLRWLSRMARPWRGGPTPPQGRFNAGQKLNTAVVGGLMAVLFATGALLWLGERNTDMRLDGSVIVHDWAAWILTALVLAHLYLALVNRSTRHALRGMTVGDVDREWAREHHAKWVEADESHGEGHDGAHAPSAVEPR